MDSRGASGFSIKGVQTCSGVFDMKAEHEYVTSGGFCRDPQFLVEQGSDLVEDQCPGWRGLRMGGQGLRLGAWDLVFEVLACPHPLALCPPRTTPLASLLCGGSRGWDTVTATTRYSVMWRPFSVSLWCVEPWGGDSCEMPFQYPRAAWLVWMGHHRWLSGQYPGWWRVCGHRGPPPTGRGCPTVCVGTWLPRAQALARGCSLRGGTQPFFSCHWNPECSQSPGAFSSLRRTNFMAEI